MPAYVFDKKTNKLVKVAGNAANADLKNVDLTSKVVLSPKLTSEKCSVTRYGNVRLNYDGRIVANNDIETGLYRFSMTHITSDEV